MITKKEIVSLQIYGSGEYKDGFRENEVSSERSDTCNNPRSFPEAAFIKSNMLDMKPEARDY